jgi:hypothetical protein
LQGTLYPDVIESCPPPGSGQKHSHTIKSHHNVGGLPKDLQFTLVEPFRELFKDEVRQIGRLLKVPEQFIGRHPFPGAPPGAAGRQECRALQASADGRCGAATGHAASPELPCRCAFVMHPSKHPSKHPGTPSAHAARVLQARAWRCACWAT